MARWLVLTGAGAVLLVLVPPAAFGASPLLSLRALGALHALHVAALAMILVAWVVFVVQLTRTGASWLRDRWALGLGIASLCAVVASIGAALIGSPASVAGAFVIAIALQVALSVRIDRATVDDHPSAQTPASSTRASAATV